MASKKQAENQSAENQKKNEKRNISFFMPMIPPTITNQQKKINTKTKKVYDTMDLKQAKAKLEANLAKHIPDVPFSKATRLSVVWLFPVRKGHFNGEYRISRPDTDNLNKALKDVMEKLKFFTNDSVVAVEYIEKRWAEKTGIYVELQDISQEKPGKKTKNKANSADKQKTLGGGVDGQ